jgi:hypothetical protein
MAINIHIEEPTGAMAYNRSRAIMKTEESLENTGANNVEATGTCEQKQTPPIEISEKAGKMMKKSIKYLKVYFWTIIIVSVLVVLRSLLLVVGGLEYGGGTTLLLVTLFTLATLGMTLVKTYAYIGDYRIFITSKSPNAWEDMLDAQKGFYGWVFVMPLILIVVSLLLFVLGDVLGVFI